MPKRFIAGARCPHCNDQDSLYVEDVGDRKFRACVSCDFREEMRFDNPVRELDTRVSKNPQKTEVQVVRMLELGSPAKAKN